jgi:hypothetical protein
MYVAVARSGTVAGENLHSLGRDVFGGASRRDQERTRGRRRGGLMGEARGESSRARCEWVRVDLKRSFGV